EQGTELQRFSRHTDKPTTVALSADGTRAVSCHCEFPGGPGKVWLWDTATGEPIANLEGTAASPLRAALFFPDRQQVLLNRGTFGQQRESAVHLWDPQPGKDQLYLDTKQDVNCEPISCMALSADGERLVVRVKKDLLLVETRTGKVLRQIDLPTLTH